MQKDILDFLSEFAVFLQDHKFAVSESALAHLLRSVNKRKKRSRRNEKNWTYLCLMLKNSWRI